MSRHDYAGALASRPGSQDTWPIIPPLVRVENLNVLAAHDTGEPVDHGTLECGLRRERFDFHTVQLSRQWFPPTADAHGQRHRLSKFLQTRSKPHGLVVCSTATEERIDLQYAQ